MNEFSWPPYAIIHYPLIFLAKIALFSLWFFCHRTVSLGTPVAHANNFLDLASSAVKDWLAGFGGQNTGMWNPVDPIAGMWNVNVPQKYYTTPTSSVQDKYGNVTNYYRSGDTTNTKIIDSYNKTFNTIHNINSTSTTNNYNYTTFNKNDYTQNNLYYNQDNSRYYISIDNSTDEYYLIDVQYSPTFVTVNYTYNTTNINNKEEVGDVTNVQAVEKVCRGADFFIYMR